MARDQETRIYIYNRLHYGLSQARLIGPWGWRGRHGTERGPSTEMDMAWVAGGGRQYCNSGSGRRRQAAWTRSMDTAAPTAAPRCCRSAMLGQMKRARTRAMPTRMPTRIPRTTNAEMRDQATRTTRGRPQHRHHRGRRCTASRRDPQTGGTGVRLEGSCRRATGVLRVRGGESRPARRLLRETWRWLWVVWWGGCCGWWGCCCGCCGRCSTRNGSRS